MSGQPQESQYKISENFKIRMIEIIDDEECDKFELGRRANVGRTIMTKATLYGIIPSVPILIKLANYLKIPILYLLGESDDKNFNPSDKPTTFRVRLQELTDEKKTTYGQIATQMPFPSSYFYDWSKRKMYPSIDYLKAIANYFHISIDYLLGRTDDRN